ncbi:MULTISPECIES: RNA pyrophosphohydrolase [unclassified Minwuia]|jgi:putative (di)nucleoside polyphosphate hydrolase|uniref:RNA pyrophosphohydrolase n=1 Tax=unclassified Minwuia TaxID=2618799 RepID=UPI00247ADA43|nr:MULTISPECIES: RNA pyrophosphohydrolase [unclassified Minwuia]
MNKSDLPYRPCVGIMLVNADNQVFVARRIDQQVEAWQMPQGGIDAGEDPETAVFREMKEEIGTDNAEILAVSEGWINYDLPDDLVGKVWKGRYRGQTQKWFLLRFNGDDSEIDIATEHPEFDAWRWASFADLADLVIPFKRESYQQVMAAFAHLFQDR